MQPDEIIQTFEWSDLNEKERLTIKDLAANEKEFNLFKALLKASKEEYLEIPALSESVKERIIVGTSTKSILRISRYWYMAAAAVIAFGFLTFLLFKNKPKNELVKQNEILKESPFVGPQIIKPADTISLAITEKTKLKIRKPNIIIKKEAEENIAADMSEERFETEFYVKSVSIKHDKELLNFITEIF